MIDRRQSNAITSSDLPSTGPDLRPASIVNAVLVEPGDGGGYAVTAHPLRYNLARHFPLAWQALEHAELVACALDATVIDRTGVMA